jgi:dihydropteroate synthase
MNRTSRGALRVRGRELPWGARTYVMGVVNVTPDSFSGDGRVRSESAVAHALEQAKRSSDILDIGAESTRPGYRQIDEVTEIARLVPVLRGVRERLPAAIISADTYKPAVWSAAHAAGADVLNSVWGLPDALLEAAVASAVPVIVMHNQPDSHYDGDVVDAVLAFLDDAARRAVRAGIPPDHVVLDPGIGFGKTPDHNIAVLRALDRIVALGFPTLLATSRKSTIGRLTGRDAHERTYGTAATVALGIAAGVDIVRVHDVAQMRDVVSVSDAIERGWRPAEWIG